MSIIVNCAGTISERMRLQKQLGPRRLSLACRPMLTAITHLEINRTSRSVKRAIFFSDAFIRDLLSIFIVRSMPECTYNVNVCSISVLCNYMCVRACVSAHMRCMWLKQSRLGRTTEPKETYVSMYNRGQKSNAGKQRRAERERSVERR